jgi:hypothetical protein
MNIYEVAKKVGGIAGEVSFRMGQAKTAFMRLNPLACGYLAGTNKTVIVEDHHSEIAPTIAPPVVRRLGEWDAHTYNVQVDGSVESFINEGDLVPGMPESNGKRAYHKHGASGSSGPYEYEWK